VVSRQNGAEKWGLWRLGLKPLGFMAGVSGKDLAALQQPPVETREGGSERAGHLCCFLSLSWGGRVQCSLRVAGAASWEHTKAWPPGMGLPSALMSSCH
jgi:hypothetical protein